MLVRNILNSDPNYLILFVTSRCNSKCKICCNWKNLTTEKNLKELKLSEFYKISENFSNLQYLTISGGEPFLRKDLPLIVKIFRNVSNLQILNISTNGSLPKRTYRSLKKILEQNPDLLVNLDISIDHIGTKHDEIRGFPGNFKLLQKTHEKLLKLKATYDNFTLRSSTVFSNYNQEQIIGIYNYIKENFQFDVPTISLIRGNVKDREAKQVDMLKYIKLVKYLKKTINKERFANFFTKLLVVVKQIAWDYIANIIIRKFYPIRCTSGKKMIVIDHLANVYPCEILNRSYGNMRDVNFDLKALLNSEEGKKIKHHISSNKCICTFECAIQNSIVNNRSNYYLVLKRLFSR